MHAKQWIIFYQFHYSKTLDRGIDTSTSEINEPLFVWRNEESRHVISSSTVA